MDQEQIDRIESNISQFYEVLQEALSMRLSPWSDFASTRERAEGMADQMVVAANLATEIEEKISLMLIIQQHIDMLWDEAMATYLEKSPHAHTDRYRSFKENLYAVVSDNSDLYALKKRLDASVEAGKRAVERMQSLHAVASRAAGIAYGQA
jgi:hypothetical protein